MHLLLCPHHHPSLQHMHNMSNRLMNNGKSVPLAFWNCHSLSTSIDNIRAMLCHRQHPLGMLALCETKWDASRSLPSIHNYTWYYQHHYPSCGGIACLVHDDVAATWVDHTHPTLSSLSSTTSMGLDSEDSSALCWIELKPAGWTHSILIGILYLRPPVQSAVLSRLFASIDRAQQLIGHDHPILLMGDWNLRHPFWDASVTQPDTQASRLMSYLDDHHLSIINNVFHPCQVATRPASGSSLLIQS